jgi:NADH:ubiquinone oxidoreductase subunit 3 (subunit A)
MNTVETYIPMLVSIAIGCVVIIIGFFMKQTLSKVDKNQELLFERLNGHESRLSRIEGEHEVYTKGGFHK